MATLTQPRKHGSLSDIRDLHHLEASIYSLHDIVRALHMLFENPVNAVLHCLLQFLYKKNKTSLFSAITGELRSLLQKKKEFIEDLYVHNDGGGVFLSSSFSFFSFFFHFQIYTLTMACIRPNIGHDS